MLFRSRVLHDILDSHIHTDNTDLLLHTQAYNISPVIMYYMYRVLTDNRIAFRSLMFISYLPIFQYLVYLPSQLMPSNLELYHLDLGQQVVAYDLYVIFHIDEMLIN